MCNAGSPGIVETGFWGGKGIGITFGQGKMILTIQNHARENTTLLGISWVFSGL